MRQIGMKMPVVLPEIAVIKVALHYLASEKRSRTESLGSRYILASGVSSLENHCSLRSFCKAADHACSARPVSGLFTGAQLRRKQHGQFKIIKGDNRQGLPGSGCQGCRSLHKYRGIVYSSQQAVGRSGRFHNFCIA